MIVHIIKIKAKIKLKILKIFRFKIKYKYFNFYIISNLILKFIRKKNRYQNKIQKKLIFSFLKKSLIK